MELYDVISEQEKRIQMMADQQSIPLGGTMELLPLCNMACKMCYVRMSREEMRAQGKMLSCEEWLRIAEEGKKEGLLYLLITGGEPLIYPDFRRLYAGLNALGMIISVNTNGTLIDEEWAKFFGEHTCRRLSITLYGKDDDTYARLCDNPHGFSQVMRAAQLLKENHVPFRFTASITQQNVEQMEALYAIAKEFDVALSVATYMYPAARRGVDAAEQVRLTPEKQAAATIRSFQLRHPQIPLKTAVRESIQKMLNPPVLKMHEGFVCHAGHSGFWINWKGEMLPCGMLKTPYIDIRRHSFHECWKYIVEESKKIPKSSKCLKCPKQNFCRPCPAMSFAETGSFTGCPEHNCRMVDEMFRLWLGILGSDADASKKGEPLDSPFGIAD